MSENIMEANPYDRLIEQEPVPVKSPVIFSGENKPVKEQQTLEMTPLTENAVYEKVLPPWTCGEPVSAWTIFCRCKVSCRSVK